jgi:hypothetical protein
MIKKSPPAATEKMNPKSRRAILPVMMLRVAGINPRITPGINAPMI